MGYCVQQETRKLSRDSSQGPHDEGTLALVAHARKGKRNIGMKNTGRRSTLDN